MTIGGFKAAGLWVKVCLSPPPLLSSFSVLTLIAEQPQDCIVFSIAPPDPLKGPIGDMRIVIPIRLVTDPWYPGIVPSDALVLQASPTASEVHIAPPNGDAAAGQTASSRYDGDSYLGSEDKHY